MKLPPENEEGNVEYKLMLTNTSDIKKKRLCTQMNWRLYQSRSGIEATDRRSVFYVIGVYDNGECEGIKWKDMKETITILIDCANFLKLGFIIRKMIKLDLSFELENRFLSIIEIYERSQAIKIRDDMFLNYPTDYNFLQFKKVFTNINEWGV